LEGLQILPTISGKF